MKLVTFITRLFRLSARQKLPRLRHHFTNGRKMDNKDDKVHILLEAGLYRDWSEAKRLVDKRKLSADELYWMLSKAARPNWKRRLQTKLIRLFGGLPYDPYKAEIIRISKGIYTKEKQSQAVYYYPKHATRVINSPQSKE